MDHPFLLLILLLLMTTMLEFVVCSHKSVVPEERLSLTVLDSIVAPNNISTFQPKYGWLHVYLTSSILSVLILCTVIGNSFVIAAILLEKNLQNVSNYLIISLAVADLMVASLVMSLSIFREVSKKWFLGLEICDLWVCFDVLCCSASILHLVAIAIDRYWALTDIHYVRTRTARRIFLMIGIVWVIAIFISIPARFHINRQHRDLAVKVIYEGICEINEEYVFTVFSLVGAFYLPMLFMFGLYGRIYLVARARIRRQAFRKRLRSQQYAAAAGVVATRKSQQPGHCPCQAGLLVGSRSESHIVCELQAVIIADCESGVGATVTANSAAEDDDDSDSSCCLAARMAGPGIAAENGAGSPLEEMSSVNQDSSTFSYSLPEHAVSESEVISNSQNHRVPSICPVKNRRFAGRVRLVMLRQLVHFRPGRKQSSPAEIAQTLQQQQPQTPISPTHFRELVSKAGDKQDFSSYQRQQRESNGGSGVYHFTSRPSRGLTTAEKLEHRRHKLEQQRERKAARTLAIITGCFILCWLPFFIQATMVPFCGKRCRLPDWLSSLVLWLGYCNSLLNPVIYTIFSPEFRGAFRKILFGRYLTGSTPSNCATTR